MFKHGILPMFDMALGEKGGFDSKKFAAAAHVPKMYGSFFRITAQKYETLAFYGENAALALKSAPNF